MQGSQIRKRLKDGQRVYGTHITSLPNPNITMMSAAMNLDFAFFCTEHLPLNREEISLLCRFYAKQCGVSPIVRVASAADPIDIAMLLDAGAEGIIVPYVETVEEVRRAAEAIRYRPLKGQQLKDISSGKHRLSDKMKKYLGDFNCHNYLIVGIESVPAIQNLEALITAAEVDAVFLGPHDITTSMGIPEEYDHPDFVRTIEDVIRRCRKQGVGVGIHLPLLHIDRAILQRYLDAGLNFLINGTDIVILREAMNAQIHLLRSLTEDPHTTIPVDRHEREIQSCIV